MKKITDIQELRSIQMGILDHVHQFCKANNIRYFLYSGTLIGAVRHKGYIPWDDDIDIGMPRADYERFLHAYEGSTHYQLLNPRRERNYFYTFAKVIDRRTRMKETETKGFEIGVYIDVFPIDYVTDDMKERQRIFSLKKMLYKIRRCKISRSNYLHSRLAYLCYRYLPISVTTINRWIEDTIILPEPTHTVCNMTEAGPGIEGCYDAEDIATEVDIEFEKHIYKAMGGYKNYLERTYGDYMQIPPENQRVTHKFEAYWL